MESQVRLGPFAAYEIENIMNKLNGIGISYDLDKTTEAEDKQIKNNLNAILRTEFRTDVFLDQSYYILFDESDREKVLKCLEKWVGTEQSTGDELNLSTAEEWEFAQANSKRSGILKSLRSLLVFTLLGYLLIVILYSIFEAQ